MLLFESDAKKLSMTAGPAKVRQVTQDLVVGPKPRQLWLDLSLSRSIGLSTQHFHGRCLGSGASAQILLSCLGCSLAIGMSPSFWRLLRLAARVQWAVIVLSAVWCGATTSMCMTEEGLVALT